MVQHDGRARKLRAELSSILNVLAAATLTACHYPKEGSRHEFALALSGFLLRQSDGTQPAPSTLLPLWPKQPVTMKSTTVHPAVQLQRSGWPLAKRQ